jgi:hypothetical protein
MIGAHSGTAPERNRIGARLCAKHQPQHVEKLCAPGVFQQAGFAKLLRLVPFCGTQPRSGGSARMRPVVEDGHYRSATVAIDFTGAHRAPLQIKSP